LNTLLILNKKSLKSIKDLLFSEHLQVLLFRPSIPPSIFTFLIYCKLIQSEEEEEEEKGGENSGTIFSE